MSCIERKKRTLLLAAGMAALTAMPPAFAQEAPSGEQAPQAPPAQDDGAALEDIVVTADRTGTEAVQVGSFRGARQLDVPLTVSVIPKELIETQLARSVGDALKNSAGVSQSQVSSTVYSNLAVRGIDIDNRGNYRLNGSLPIVNLVGLPLENKERVEALKGASALYYGFTTPSGIINMIMERPTSEQTFGAAVFGNSYGELGGSVDYGNTWADGTLGARLNGVYAHLDSGIDNTAGRRSLISGAFDIKPTDSVIVTLDLERIYTRAGEPATYRYATFPAQTVGNPDPTGVLPVFRRNTLNFSAGKWVQTYASETNVLTSVRWKFARAWELSGSIGSSDSYRYRKSGFIDFGRPLGGDTYTLTIGNAPRERNLNTNYRAELAGVISLGRVTNNILAGASQNIRNRDNPNTVNATFTQNIANPLTFAEVPFASPNYNTGAIVGARRVQINDIGYYVFNRLSFGNVLDVLGGVRFSDYTERQRFTGVTTFHGAPTSFSYGAVLKPLRALSIYGTYIEGLEATPGAPQTALNSGAQLPPSESEQYEAGIKFEPKPGVLLTAAYFDINRGAAFVNGANLYVVDGRQTYRGGEFSATGRFTRDLTVYATALILDAKYVEGSATVLSANAAGVATYLNTTTGACTTAVPTSNAGALRCQTTTNVGNRVDGAPKNTFSLSADYKLSAVLPGLSLNAGIFHVGSRALDARNLLIVPGFTTFNLGAGYDVEISGARTNFRLSWENVGDKRYWATAGADFLAQGTPSTVKFSVSTGF
jgi:iron complex outermembrane receptor protein